MRLEYMTHASLLLKTPRMSLLTDPFFLYDTHFPPRAFDLKALGTLNYVFSSHDHVDHAHPETLEVMREQIENVLIPADRPELEKRYRQLGYKRVELLGNGETYALPDGSKLTCCWSDSVNSVALIEIDGKTILHQNDCHMSQELMRKIASRFSIDYAFLLYCNFQSLCPVLLDRPEEEKWDIVTRREARHLEHQLEVIDALKPKWIIPYSMTLTYFETDLIKMNGYGRMTPTVFARRVREKRANAEVRVLQPGDVIDTATDQLTPYRRENLWGETLDEFLANIRRHTETLPESFRTFDIGTMASLEPILLPFLKERMGNPFLPEVAKRVIAVHVHGKDRKVSYLIDVPAKRATVVGAAGAPEPSAPPFLEITIPASLLEKLLRRIRPAFAILYFYHTSFKVNVPLHMTPEEETQMYVRVFVMLFESVAGVPIETIPTVEDD